MVHRLYILILLAVLMAACSSDDVGTGGTDWSDADGMVTVGLRFSAAGSGASTRAWQDNENATDNEMMNLWTVVVADAAGNVQAIHACKPTGDTKPEVDDYVNLTPGIYTFYSFANMAPSVVMQLLGISGTGATGGEVTRGGNGNLNFNLNDNTNPNENPNENPDANPNEDPTQGGNEENANPPKSNQDDIATKKDDTVYEIAFDANAKITVTPEDVKVGVDGNNFDPTAAENGFGAMGIPMCNVQTKEITTSTTFDLIVVRMMAKMELQIKNETGAAVTIKSATLSNVTQNDNGNLKLLPALSNHDTMEPTHKDIQPNLGTASQGNVTVAVNKDVAVNATETVTFYVNESATPANAEGLFYLTLEMDNSGTSEYRYALISNNDANEWNYIARNDYRKIPIVLDDLKFEIIPYDFPPIGVYPCSVKEVDAVNHIYDFQFHDYGHFHLLPTVTQGGAAVAFSATTPTSGSEYKWTLTDNDFSKSWFTATAYGAASWMTPSQVTATGFYRNQTATADGDEVGGEPYWYANDGSAGARWDPAAAGNYRPFIFGYIADPGSATEKKIYHEMRIQVYNGTTAYRQMLYRFYMTLSAEQML